MWGAALSTSLALIKIWEIWRARRRLDYGYNFTDDPKIGNEITIRNLSSTAIIISYWELVWLKSKWYGFKKEETKTITAEHDFSDWIIAPHSSQKLTFSEGHYFSWSGKANFGTKLYLRVMIAGEKRPRLAKIYG